MMRARGSAALASFLVGVFAGCEAGAVLPPEPPPPELSPDTPSTSPGSPAAVTVRLGKDQRGFTVETEDPGWFGVGDRVDVVAVVPDRFTRSCQAVTVLQDVAVISVRSAGDAGRTRLALSVERGEAIEALTLAEAIGSIHPLLRPTDDHETIEDLGRATIHTLLTPQARSSLEQIRRDRVVRDEAPRVDGHADPLASIIPAGTRGVTVRVGAWLDGLRPGDRVDVLAALPEPPEHEAVAVTLLEDILVAAVREDPEGRGGTVLLVTLLEEAEMLHVAAALGSVRLVSRNPDDVSTVDGERSPTRVGQMSDDERRRSAAEARVFGGRAHLGGTVIRGMTRGDTSPEAAPPVPPVVRLQGAGPEARCGPW